MGSGLQISRVDARLPEFEVILMSCVMVGPTTTSRRGCPPFALRSRAHGLTDWAASLRKADAGLQQLGGGEG